MRRIRLAVVGVGRGRVYISAVPYLSELVDLVAVCDANPDALAQWTNSGGVRGFTEYEDVLQDPDIDAVCLATPSDLHARQAIRALEAGKHVLCEVTAAQTLEECRDLITAVQSSGRIYMMAENYCFFREILMVQNMVEAGLFGELVHAEGSYLHDCRGAYVREDGELTWRGALQRDSLYNWYPTHSMGPVCRWLGINKTDYLTTTATWGTGAKSIAAYCQRNFAPDHPARQIEWRTPDSMHTLARTQNGALIEHRLDLASPIPRPQNRYTLQGTHGSFSVNHYVEFRASDPEPQIWLADQSPTHSNGAALEWESLWKYADQWEHPLWREYGQVAEACGQDGGVYFTLREFAGAIIEERPPLFDVYDAATWSSFTPLSAQSLAQDNAPVEVPNWKQQYAGLEPGGI